MKISLNWIKEYTKIKLTPDELVERVSVSLTEAEGIEKFGERYKGIVVAEVVEVKDHHEADNLILLKLDTGEQEVQSVVQNCNVKKGWKVAYIKPGFDVPGFALAGKESKVKKTKIKGAESNGFVPSGRELGLNYDHSTVYKVADDAKIGQPLSEVLDLTDNILEVENKALTHRPDTFSIIGMARELSAIQGAPLEIPEWLENPKEFMPKPKSEDVQINIKNEAEVLCPRYMAVVIDNVKVGPSPRWMQVRLSKMGLRPVNNVVDISNYLMLLTGQPSHAFDFDRVVKKDTNASESRANITIRTANPGEKITVIDGETKTMDDEVLVIADSENALGVAGVMGGKDTEIQDDTTRVIYQVENIEMYNNRKTSMKLGISSDAVTRFSKGQDPNLCEPVMYKAIEMFKEIAGGEVVSEVYDQYPDPGKDSTVTINTDEAREWIGQEISDKEIQDILGRLQLGIRFDSKSKSLTVNVPTWRSDLNIKEDIYEEIVRIYGYDRIRPTLPTRRIHPVKQDKERVLRNKIKSILMSAGGNEIYGYAFVGRELYENCGLEVKDLHKLKNPLSPEVAYMRSLIYPSLLERLPHNLNLHEEIACFEIDLVNPAKKGEIDPKKLPDEPKHLGLVHTSGYYDLKKYVEIITDALNISEVEVFSYGQTSRADLPDWIQRSLGGFHPGRLALIKIKEVIVGMMGQVDPVVAEKLGLPEKVATCELNLDFLIDFELESRYQKVSKYPAVIQDFTFITDKDVPYLAIENAIRIADSKSGLIMEIECRDIYVESDDAEEKKTSFRIQFQSDERTLEEKEIESLRENIVKSVEKQVDGRLDAD